MKALAVGTRRSIDAPATGELGAPRAAHALRRPRQDLEAGRAAAPALQLRPSARRPVAASRWSRASRWSFGRAPPAGDQVVPRQPLDGTPRSTGGSCSCRKKVRRTPVAVKRENAAARRARLARRTRRPTGARGTGIHSATAAHGARAPGRSTARRDGALRVRPRPACAASTPPCRRAPHTLTPDNTRPTVLSNAIVFTLPGRDTPGDGAHRGRVAGAVEQRPPAS
jgi:hypothetical protein